MNNFRKITKLNGNKKFLLKEMGYKSIKEAKQYIDEETNKKNSNEKVYKYIQKKYNYLITLKEEEEDDDKSFYITPKPKPKRKIKKTDNILKQITLKEEQKLKPIKVNKKPYHITITNTVKYFQSGAPSHILQTYEVINKRDDGTPLIFKAENEGEIKKQVDDLNRQKYHENWNGYNGIFKTPHNMQFNGLLCNIDTYIIYILFETTYKATLPPKNIN